MRNSSQEYWEYASADSMPFPRESDVRSLRFRHDGNPAKAQKMRRSILRHLHHLPEYNGESEQIAHMLRGKFHRLLSLSKNAQRCQEFSWYSVGAEPLRENMTLEECNNIRNQLHSQQHHHRKSGNPFAEDDRLEMDEKELQELRREHHAAMHAERRERSNVRWAAYIDSHRQNAAMQKALDATDMFDTYYSAPQTPQQRGSLDRTMPRIDAEDPIDALDADTAMRRAYERMRLLYSE